MPTVIDLATLGSFGFAIIGADASNFSGLDVSGAGDVNGDGLDDLIIATDVGSAYVVFGRANGFGTIDLENLAASDGFHIQHNDGEGFSVAAAGDINGDGFDDIILGAYAYSPYGYGYEAVPTGFVVFGRSSDFGTISVTGLNPPSGFGIVGPEVYGYVNLAVSSAGDVNGDGFDDIIVGSPYEGDADGAAYIIFGKASGFGSIDLTTLPASAGFKIIGDPGNGDFIGVSVSSAGDVNGDGFDDLIVGGYYGDSGGTLAGEAYVIFGKASGFGTINLGSLAPGSGFIIQGGAANEYAGFSVSGAGDVNGDGYDDLLIGAPGGSGGGADSGHTYVVFGKASGFGTVDLANLSASAGFKIIGDDTGDTAGWSVASAGDVNGDGYDDIIIGAPANDTTRGSAPRVIDAGEAYVIFGRAGGFGTIDLTNLSTADGFIVQGEAANDFAGWSVSGAGDINGDGLDDLIVGAPGNDRGGSTAGTSYVIFGRVQFATDVRNDFNGDGRSDILWRSDSGLLIDWLGKANGGFADNGGNSFGSVATSWSIAATGDFNGDGRDDLIWRHANGQLTEWLGKPNGGFVDNGGNASYNISTTWSIAGVGDFNGDGREDLIWRNASGQITEWLGGPGGRFADNGAVASYNIGSSWSVAAIGDFNGDGRDDVLLRHVDGLVTEWLGKTNGGFTDNGAVASYNIPGGWSIAGAGDFNGDGRDDVLWRHNNGMIINWLGTASGGFVDNGANSFNTVSTAWAVEAIGDYNGDGRDDILWRHSNGTIINWLGTANGGYADNGANSFGSVATNWQVQPESVI